MTSIDFLKGEVEELKRRIRALETQSPLESSSVSDGRVRFIGGLLRVDSGGRVEIVGTLEVDGVTTVTGTFTVEGPWEITGDGAITGFLQVTGSTQIDGPTTINGNFWVNGRTRLANDLIVQSDGRILAGNIVIDPTNNGGSVKFSGGPEVFADGSRLSLYSGIGAFIELDGDVAKINGPGARWFEVNSSGFRFVGLPTKPQADVPGSIPGMIWADSSGNAFRIVS